MIGFFYDFLILLPMSLLGVSLSNKYIIMEDIGIAMYVFAALLVAFVLLIRHSSLQIRILSLGIFTILVIGTFYFIKIFNSDYLKDFPFNKLLCLIAPLIVSLLGILINGLYINKIVYLVLAGLGLALGYAFNLSFSMFEVALFIYIILFCFLHFVQKKSPDIKKYVTFVAIFFIVFCVLTSFIKAPEKPYDWHGFRVVFSRIGESVSDFTDMMFNKDARKYDISMVGFSESGKLSSPEKSDDRIIMSITTGRQKNESLYLVGQVYKDFNGREWSPFKQGENDEFYDAMETLNASRYFSSTKSGDYIKREGVDIHYKKYWGKTVFYPAKPLDIIEIGGGRKKAFKITFSIINRNEEAIKELLNKDITIDEYGYNFYSKTYAGNHKTQSYEGFLKYQESIDESFLSEVTLPEEIKEWISLIDSSFDNDYDKLCALESSLKELRYVNSVPPLPEGINSEEAFLDYFFKKGEGSCMFYATSFVLLARYMGIPARYVQGYLIPCTGEETVNVTSSMAHAWAQAYIKGVGFITFDATPGSGNIESWLTIDQRKQAYSERNKDAKPPLFTPPIEEELSDISEEPVNEEEPLENLRKNRAVRWYYILSVVTVTDIFIAAFIAIKIKSLNKKIQKQDQRSRCLSLCRLNMNLLEYLGYKKDEGETLSEYLSKTEKSLSKVSLSFLPVFEILLYSDKFEDTYEKTVTDSLYVIKETLKEDKKLLFIWFYLKGLILI